MIIGNKSDREVDREIATTEGEAYASAKGFTYLESSAKSGSNIETVFRTIAEEVLSRLSHEQIIDNSRTSFRVKATSLIESNILPNAPTKPPRKKKKCC
jgi:hypothetical protein